VRIKAQTPNRIDLAGGTLDIWPLYTFLGGGYTINAAIDLGSEVWLETRDDGKFDIYSEDLGEGEMFDSLDDLRPGGPMELVVRALMFWRPKTGLNIRTHNRAPKGTGLGSSSALLIALLGALHTVEGKKIDKQRLIDLAANIEAQTLVVPTGKQDYYAAAYGGVNAIWFGLGGDSVEPLIVDEQVLRELDERLLLSFTGETRFSGTSNWNMMKAYIDNLGKTRENLKAIARTSAAMRECLLAGDFDRFAEVLDEEWSNRKGLAEGVTTPQIERLMAAAREAGAMASKICGAGGGGCMITFVRPGAQEQVIAALEENGATHMPYHIQPQGLTVEEC